MSQYLDKDGATRIAENFLSKQAEQDAILRNLQFDLKEAEHALVKTIQGPAPLNIRALSRPLDDYMISGNTVQNGTPTPEAPVDVVGCGVKTGNLFDYRKSFNPDVIVYNNYFVYYLLALQPNATYTAYTNCESKVKPSYNTTTFIIVPDEIQFSTENGGVYKNTPKTFTTQNSGLVKVGIRVFDDSNDPLPIYQENDFANCEQWLMLNAGSAPLPYEPYGYKLPLTVEGTEYPIYLGQVETTRRIRKLVLTGEESVESVGGGDNHTYFRLQIGNIGYAISDAILSTHFHQATVTTQSTTIGCNIINSTSFQKCFVVFRPGSVATTSLTQFKRWLSDQYAAGTPVTVWYILANEETGIVNEPLHKIGNYADTISMAQAGATLTTTKGFNTITADTTVLPSNIEVKGVINNA